MSNHDPTAEEIERDLQPAIGVIAAAADELAQRGYRKSSRVLRAIAEMDDADEMFARVWLALEAAGPGEQANAMCTLFDVVAAIAESGEQKMRPAAIRLLEMLEQIGTVYGLPGERLPGAN